MSELLNEVWTCKLRCMHLWKLSFYEYIDHGQPVWQMSETVIHRQLRLFKNSNVYL